MRILYLQYTNPAGYPCLEHSSRILADAGWEALFLGKESQGTAGLELPTHPSIRVARLGPGGTGGRQKAHYAGFCLWALWQALRWKPKWIYASDPLACPAALLLSRLLGTRVVYHEHDSPVQAPELEVSGTSWRSGLLAGRREMASRAAICILPNEKRGHRFRRSTGTRRPVVCVWNCPSRIEALPAQTAECEELVLHYHGNIGPELVPLTVVRAVALVPGTQLQIVGYTTVGQQLHLEALRYEAVRTGITDRVKIVNAMSRRELLHETRKASVGLALMPMNSANPNFQSMVGASNKPFDYLACGVPVLVSDLPEWRATFVQPGYGLACNPGDAGSIAQALRWVFRHRSAARLMGELGRQRILDDWNYEEQFKSVAGQLYLDSKSGRGIRAG